MTRFQKQIKYLIDNKETDILTDMICYLKKRDDCETCPFYFEKECCKKEMADDYFYKEIEK